MSLHQLVELNVGAGVAAPAAPTAARPTGAEATLVWCPGPPASRPAPPPTSAPLSLPAAFTAAAQAGLMDSFLSVRTAAWLGRQCSAGARRHCWAVGTAPPLRPPPSSMHHPAHLPSHCLQVDPDMQARVLEKYAQHVKELKQGARHG